jgi:hypothetical protein
MENKTIDHLSLARRIRAAGRPIHIAEDDCEVHGIPTDGLRVYQRGGTCESCIVAVRSYGGLAVIIDIGITFNLPNFAISAFGLELPWKNESFYWLPDPREIGDDSEYYRFGVGDLPTFERSRVLNHYANQQKIYSKGQSLGGNLLGFSTGSIPEEFRHGTMIDSFVDIFDQFGRVYRTSVQLWLDRSCRQTLVLRKRRQLINHIDPGSEHASLEKEAGHVKA